MEVRIALSTDEDGSETRILADWLQADDELTDAAISLQHAPLEKGDMGGAASLIDLVFQPQGVIFAVVSSVATWLGTRRKPAKVHVRIGSREVTIEGDSIEQAERTAKELLGLSERR